MKKNQRRQNRKRHNKGFTLIEIMIVLGIVGMLFGFVGVNLISKFKESKVSAAKIQMAALEQALQAYYVGHSSYPTTAQGLQSLVAAPTVGKVPKNYPEGGYLGKKNVPKDPFGNDYRYVCEDAASYTISSDGPDGEPGTGDDIVQE